MSKGIHIVSMDVPYPPIYGGIIDVYYCVKGFADAGYDVHLHCFEYGRGDAEPLKKICKSVHLYKRDMSGKHLFKRLPFIVSTRNSIELIDNLSRDDYPILLEGLHCTYALRNRKEIKKRICVRTHNIEHDYYARLAEVEVNFLKRMFFRFESKKLSRYEKILNNADCLAAISSSDYDYFSSKYQKVEFVSAFHPYDSVEIKTGMGEYALYHGNLTVGENVNAALYLLDKVFNKTGYPLIIAGNNPDKRLVEAAMGMEHVSIHSDLSLSQINELIQNAQINILPTFQATGIKLKLLAALHLGRWCLVNKPMVTNTGLESLCVVKDSPEALIEGLEEYRKREFPEEESVSREKVLLDKFGNKTGIKKLEMLLYK